MSQNQISISTNFSTSFSTNFFSCESHPWAEKISLYVVWWSLFLLFLITSASTCLQHSRNHVQRNILSSVRTISTYVFDFCRNAMLFRLASVSIYHIVLHLTIQRSCLIIYVGFFSRLSHEFIVIHLIQVFLALWSSQLFSHRQFFGSEIL